MIGANREIKALSKLVRDREESLFAFFAEEGIEWSFIPPRSPNWGGLWEANIKSLKYHFKRVAGNSKFSYEELLTLITQIKAILNSRPLTPLSSDVDDLEVLTPAHFLIGRPITAIVEPSLLQCESNRLNVWQRITKSIQTIWKRWSLSYLNSLQQRKKWIVNKENLKLGDMVLIREENLPPCKWLLGRVQNNIHCSIIITILHIENLFEVMEIYELRKCTLYAFNLKLYTMKSGKGYEI
ncbi:integrase catalytic domain-containing protein [Trichonephila clavipes]|uniref:Integrase catalytic domain-containing protein n=1 Tax=Trichonephila clavipes TaxID=2585209 RepID=A0A8X6SLV0_TRICX|nr:integrase catalytic domain-containing protein [Trichonephila clavipes]